MRYVDYKFTITEDGLKLDDKGDSSKFDQVDIKRTPLKVGDTFVLELDEDNCMFFRKTNIVTGM